MDPQVQVWGPGLESQNPHKKALQGGAHQHVGGMDMESLEQNGKG